MSWIFPRKSSNTKMVQKSGDNSTSIQVAGNIEVSSKDKDNDKKIVIELNLLYQNKKWDALSEKLESIRQNKSLQDCYFYYKGVLLLYNSPNSPRLKESSKLVIINDYSPEFFFKKISPGSDYYEKSRKKLVYFYSYSIGSDNNIFVERINSIVEEMENNSFDPLYYFYLKWLALWCGNGSYNETYNMLQKLKEKSAFIMEDNYEVKPFNILAGQGPTKIDLKFEALDSPVIAYLYISKLLISEYHEKPVLRQSKWIDELNKVLSRNKNILKDKFNIVDEKQNLFNSLKAYGLSLKQTKKIDQLVAEIVCKIENNNKSGDRR